MKVKHDSFYLNVLINGLYTQRSNYIGEKNKHIDTHILRLVNESETMKTNQKNSSFSQLKYLLSGNAFLIGGISKYKPKKKLPLSLSENCLKSLCNERRTAIIRWQFFFFRK